MALLLTAYLLLIVSLLALASWTFAAHKNKSYSKYLLIITGVAGLSAVVLFVFFYAAF